MTALRVLILALFITISGCGVFETEHVTANEIRSALQITAKASDGVAGFRFEVYNFIWQDGGYVPNLLETRYVSVEEGALPTYLMPAGIQGAGNNHNFADAFFNLELGDYFVKVYPMKSESEPSDACSLAESQGMIKVEPGRTKEVVLVSHCEREDTGALDAVMVLNNDPLITSLTFDRGRFIDSCEDLVMTVVAEDPDNDPLVYEWLVLEYPGQDEGLDAMPYEMIMDQDRMTFRSFVPGDYLVMVRACDPYDICASLSFPIYVTGGICEVEQPPD